MDYKEFKCFFNKAYEIMDIRCNDMHSCAECYLKCSAGGCSVACPEEMTEEQFNFIQNYGFTDWNKVPIDAKIVVWTDYLPKCKRHFAKYKDGRVYSFVRGKSSYTAANEHDLEVWPHAELAKENE